MIAPAMMQTAPATGEIGIDSVLSWVTFTGPTSITFSCRVHCSPP